MTTSAPVLFLIFNRPKETKAVFAAIRMAKPKTLFVAADGPREKVFGEEKKCEAARKITEKVDWPCKVKRLYRKNNLGCKKAVSDAVTWFFQNVKEGIVLEDDCLPNKSFFRFCEDLLKKYRNDSRVGIIGGTNFSGIPVETSYYFSIYPQIWGWATWRRTWKNYDVKMKNWPKLDRKNWLNKLFSDWHQVIYWWSVFDSTYRGRVDTWDYQLVFSCLVKNLVNVVPKVNLVKNIGFGGEATHLKKLRSEFTRKVVELSFPLRHPKKIEQNMAADKVEAVNMYSQINSVVKVKWLLFRLIGFFV